MVGCIKPDWPAPANVEALVTTRADGVSQSPFDSCNLAFHVGEELRNVEANWDALVEQADLPARPQILSQVHGNRIIELPGLDYAAPSADRLPEADGVYTRTENTPCTVLTADCLPVLLCDVDGSQVAALHAGWRGLAADIIGEGVATFPEPGKLMAWLGPAICPSCFEVGNEVREIFLDAARSWGDGKADLQAVEGCFFRRGFQMNRDAEHWFADLYQLARLCLNASGVTRIYGGDFCTVEQKDLWYSYRRDGKTGRMASMVWLTDP
ncbi:MAG: peptidoglycan editing factor PgeF [bacterium]